jgi:membrane protease subunit (stomatin/prohibitin family)
MIRLRAYGSFSIQIDDAMLFVNKVVGTMGLYTTFVIEDYLRGIIASKLNTVIGKSLQSVFDISLKMDELNLILRTELFEDFKGLGLKLHDMYIHSISVPEEVQKMIDTKSGMNAVGNLDQYMKLKIADSLGKGTAGGEMSEGLGLGAGIGMGMAMPNLMQQAIQTNAAESVTEKLKNLKELLDLGALTQEEFEAKKKELLKQI